MKFVVLVRGVNVGGHRALAMADLRAFLTDLELTGVASLLQSGNLVCTGDHRTTAAVERLLESEAEPRLKVPLQFMTRTADEWASLIAGNPFGDEAERDPAHLTVTCLKGCPSDAAIVKLTAGIVGRERVRCIGRELYAVFPDDIGRSRLTHAIVERTLGMRGTARNWNTVAKIGALLGI